MIEHTVTQQLQAFWDNDQFVDFYHLRDVFRKYRDLKIYERHGKRYYSSLHANVCNDNKSRIKIEFDNNQSTPTICPALLWIGRQDDEVGCFVHTQPLFVEVGIRNPNGFGVVAMPGWEKECVAMGLNKTKISFVKSFLEKNPPINYLV